MARRSITEFATLKLKEPHTWTSPATIAFFRKVSAQQAAWSGYPLLFRPSDDLDMRSGLVYLISGWKNVQAHQEWTASSQNQTLLKEATTEDLLMVEGLAHIDIDFEELPTGPELLILERREEMTVEAVDEHRASLGVDGWHRTGAILDDGVEEIWLLCDDTANHDHLKEKTVMSRLPVADQ